MNQIIVPHGVNKKLAGIFGSSLPFVRKCLRGKSDNELAPKIRKAALENGGIEVVIKEEMEVKL